MKATIEYTIYKIKWLNHITGNLDDSLRTEAKLFQLTGNDSIETLLEILSTKMSSKSLSMHDSSSSASSAVAVQYLVKAPE